MMNVEPTLITQVVSQQNRPIGGYRMFNGF